MNLQSMTIIFVIIFLPIILISTYYIQREVDTITLQTSYDTKLIDATTDAVSAFEINTANEDLSHVSDSLRSIIEASNNVFTTTMATNLGMSGATKSKILPYIPAIVYTLYDGYYIYSPTEQAKVLTDPNGVYVKVGDTGVVSLNSGKYEYKYAEVEKYLNSNGDEPDKLKNDENMGKILYFSDSSKGKVTDTIKCTIYPEDKGNSEQSAYFATSYILKSFIPYSMNYKDTDYDVTINYTLDNYITIYGTIKDGDEEVYYSKSGYLIDFTKLSAITINTTDYNLNDIINNYSQNEIDKLVEDNQIKIIFDGIEISENELSAKSEHYSGNKIEDNSSAIAYYLKAAIFSKWVSDNLSEINPSSGNVISKELKTLQEGFSIKQNGGLFENFQGEESTLFWNYTEDSIFKTNSMWNVENSESNFYEHKRKVMKNSIQYNLNLAMATYNKGQGDEYYQMPILSDPEWDKLLSNVSVLAFMQGLPCGLKTYNNYALVTSTNNEIMANVDDIYYVPVANVNYKDFEELEDKLQNGDISNDDLKNELKFLTSYGTKIGLLSTQQIQLLKFLYKPNFDELTTDIDKQNTMNGINGMLKNMYYNNIALSEAHKISHLNFTAGDIIQSFPSREIKYDKVYNPNTRAYEFDHICSTCYDCIVNSNFNNWYEDYKILSTKIERTTSEEERLNEIKNLQEFNNINTLKKIELIAIGKIRNNTYKSCAIQTNNGIFVEEKNEKLKGDGSLSLQLTEVNKCYEIQITIRSTDDVGKYGTNTINLGNEQLNYKCNIGDDTQTLIFDESSKWGDGNLSIGEYSNADGDKITIEIVSITYKYK